MKIFVAIIIHQRGNKSNHFPPFSSAFTYVSSNNQWEEHFMEVDARPRSINCPAWRPILLLLTTKIYTFKERSWSIQPFMYQNV